MSRNAKLSGRSPSAIASTWLDHQLVAVLANIHFARRLPQDEAALAVLLMDRFLPYLELFTLGRTITASADAEQAFGVAPAGKGRP